MNSKWIYNEKESNSALIESYGEVFAKILSIRNISTLEQAKEFFEPEKYLKEVSPYSFVDMEKSVERIKKAIELQEKIIVWGDFDADGVTSTSILFNTLKYLGANVDFYIPHRISEGHGLNTNALIKLKTSLKMKLLITVDCGISNHTQVKLLNGFSVDTIITDHHETTQQLPLAFAILNAHAENTLKPDLTVKEIESLNNLAGVGVAYKLCSALLNNFKKEKFLLTLLPLVAIGTIADVVPLLGENRLLIKKGVEQIKKNCPKGVEALLKIAGLDKNNCSSQDIAFGIAPRINAIGRLEHTKQVVELFVVDDDATIQMHANYMNSCNRVRQGLCDNIFEEALSKIQPDNLKKNKAIVLVDNSWHIGVIGIIASKLSEKFYRPVFILRIDEENQKIRCSARGIAGLNLYDVLFEQKENFEVFGGHAFAAGFSAELKNLDNIIKNINSVVNETLEDEDLTPKVFLDGDLLEKDLTVNFIKNLEKFEPFGEKNPAPVFSLKDVKLNNFKTIGTNSNHLKLNIEKNNKQFEAIFWGRSVISASNGDIMDLAFTPKINTFMDKSSIQLELCDYKNNSSKKVSTIKLIDHRQKNNVFEVFLNYLKTTKTKIAIFAEKQESIEFLGGQPLQSALIINRLSQEKVDQVAFFDIPSSELVFQDVVSNTSAKVVHIIGNSFKLASCEDILKKCSGMLKYAFNNLAGEVDLKKMATKLALSEEVLLDCLRLLESGGVFQLIDKKDGILRIDFLGAKDFSSIKESEDFLSLDKKLSDEKANVFSFS